MNYTRELMFGRRPISRTDPEPGQSEWYYLDPRGADRFADMKEIDVESENSPNPYANEIQNYLYNNDSYNYKELYGNTPPPATTQANYGATDYTVNTESLVGKPSSYFQNNSGLALQPDTLTNQGMQYAQNNVPDTATDANYTKPIDYSLYGDGFSKEFIDKMLNDADYQRALNEYAIPNEKGYVNNINDPGGETNMGITKRYHPNEDIKNLTRERANAMLYNEIWNWNGIDKLPREIRGFVFDHGIRTSPQNAIETTHRALGINPVGDIIGNTTLGLLKNIDYEDFLRKYQDLVREQDRNNKNYKYFGRGWDDRTNGYHVTY